MILPKPQVLFLTAMGALIAVVLVVVMAAPLGSGTTRVAAGGQVDCGNSQGTLTPAGLDTAVYLDPDFGHTNEFFTAYVDNAQSDGFSSQQLEVIWDPGLATEELVGQGSIPQGDTSGSSFGSVPSDPARPLSHTVRVCWLNASGETWYFADVSHFVLPDISCGYQSSLQEDPGADVTLVPAFGQPGEGFVAELQYITLAGDNDHDVEVLWDSNLGGDVPDLGTKVGDGTFFYPDNFANIQAYVPHDASFGEHTVGLCWEYGAEQYHFKEVTFFVEEGSEPYGPELADTTFADTDMVSAGVGAVRSYGEGPITGTITLAGIDTDTVEYAFLYWNGPEAYIDGCADTAGGGVTIETAGSSSRNAEIVFADRNITGTNIGVSSPNGDSIHETDCYAESDTYVADVTEIVQVRGNEDYDASFLEKDDAFTNGLSLIVFFQDGNPDNNVNITLFEGNDSNAPNPFDDDGWNVLFQDIPWSGGEVTLTLHVSEGQHQTYLEACYFYPACDFWDGALVINGEDDPPLEAQGPTFEGDSVPTADATSDSVYDGGLWDIKSWDVTQYFDGPLNSLLLTSALHHDETSLVVAALAVPAGGPSSTPSPSPTPTPTPSPSPTPFVSPPPPVDEGPQSVFGVDMAAAGVGGMKGVNHNGTDGGTGSITLTGVTGNVTQALLFWHGPGAASNADVLFANNAISGENIGLSSDNCWGYTQSVAYRADVTQYVQANGTFSLANFEKDDAIANGASLIVFFDDGNDDNDHDVVLFEGNDSNQPNPYDPPGWDVLLDNIDYTGGNASITLHVSDGQGFDDDAVYVNGVQIAPIGPNFDGNTVPNSSEASVNQHVGGLWDIRSYDVTSILAGNDSLELTSGSYADCLSLVVAAVAVPAGSAPGQPTPSTDPTPCTTAAPTPSPTPTDTPTATPTETPSPTLSPTLGVSGTCPLAEGPPGDPSCDDGIDNDQDDLIDGDDPNCQATPSPSPTPSPTEVPPTQPSPSLTPTTSPTSSPSPTVLPLTPTPTATPTPTPIPTASPSPTPVQTFDHPTVSPTPSPTATPSPSPTVGEPATSTPFVTASPAPTPTATATTRPTVTDPPTQPPAITAPPTSGTAVTPTPTAISSQSTPSSGGLQVPTATPIRPTPTVTPTSVPSPTGTTGGSRSPSPTVAAVSIAPTQTDDDPAITTGSGGGNGGRPEFAQSVLTPGDISTSLDVIMLNAALAGFSLMLLLLSSELFNKTVEENHYTLSKWFKPVTSPFTAFFGSIGSGWKEKMDGSWFGALAPPIAIIFLAALIYGALEPGYGLNEKSIVMALATIITVGVVTYWYNGGQIVVAQGMFKMDAIIKLFPIGVLIAAICVILSRLDGFQPGILYGFIASAVVIGSIAPNREQHGRIIFYPALALLALSILAWFLISPFRDFATDNDSWFAALPEAVAVGVMVGALESTFFQMIPIRYLDGHKLWMWNKAAWALVAGTTGFLFWAILIHDQSSSMSSVTHGTPAAAIVAMVVCLVLSIGFYAFFRLRGPDLGPEAEPA